MGDSRTRDEHLAWCKERALEYVDRGDLGSAVASMLSDLGKHPDTARSARPPFGMLGIDAVRRGAHDVRRFILGFN